MNPFQIVMLILCTGLLRDTIILDTVCLSEAAKRVTAKDRIILNNILTKVQYLHYPVPLSGTVAYPGSGAFYPWIRVADPG
jgi:hypothetical protein